VLDTIWKSFFKPNLNKTKSKLNQSSYYAEECNEFAKIATEVINNRSRWSRVGIWLLFTEPEWIRSQDFARKPEQKPRPVFNLCFIPLM